MKVIDLWTDGACTNGQKAGDKPGRGAGGWAAIIIDIETSDGMKMAISGFEDDTTNNRMELCAVIYGLEAIGTERASVTIFTDSSYVKNAHTQGWIRLWDKNGWISSRGDPVANQDLWQQLIPLVNKHVVKWRHIKGHGNSVLNNKADELAVAAKINREGTLEFL